MSKPKTSRQKNPSDQQPPTTAPAAELARTSADHHASSGRSQPGGKLGRIIDHLRTNPGATAEELAEATGWQKHSILGALSRLRSRGFAVRLDEVDGRKAYRIEQPES